MAIVWSNSFGGTPGTNVTVANSGAHGDPIAGLRDNPPANAVRYGDRAIMGQSSMRLGAPDGAPHGNVWLHYPTSSEYSLSFYLYLPEGGWFRIRDTNVVVEFYLATASQSYIGDAHPVPDEVRDAVFDRWVRVEISTIAARSEYRIYWSDPHSTGSPDYTYEHARDGGVIDGIFTQGAGDSGATTPYLDQVRIGEGEWLGPWPVEDRTITAAATLPLAGGAEITADLDPVVWSNTFNGTHNTALTPANSGDHGDPVAAVNGTVAYTTDWAAAGSASARLGTLDGSSDGNFQAAITPVEDWAVRWYALIPAGGWTYTMATVGGSVVLAILDDDDANYQVLQQDVGVHAADLVGQPLRIEVSKTGATVTARIWWSSPHSDGAHDLQVQVTASGWGPLSRLDVVGGGFTTPPAMVDELAVALGPWIGPAVPDDVIIAAATLPLAGGSGIARHGHATASASLPLGGSAQIVRHATMEAAATLGVSAPEVDITREGRFTAAATLPLAGAAEIRSQFRATFPPTIVTELQLGGEWVDVSSDVYVRDPVQITRGRADEAATADPSTCALTLNNRHGRYSPHNPLSPYYGTLGKNTPLRVRVGPLPEDPDPEVVDTFDRTTTGGWGTTDTGQEWQGSAPGMSVAGGAAHHTLPAISTGDTYHQVLPDAISQDVDVAVSIRIDKAPQGWASGALYTSVSTRVINLSERVHAAVAFRVDMGSPAGLRVSTDFAVVEGGAYRQLTEIYTVPDLAYRPGEWLRMRVRVQGPEFRMRVWPEDQPEPAYWHSQARLEDGPEGSGLSVRSNIITSADDTPVPVTVSYRNLVVTPIIDNNLDEISRFVGEVSEWPSRWDTSDTDVWVPVTASGLLRRLGQGTKPLRSPVRRTVEGEYPIAYWPMEDGARTREAASPVPGVAPLRTTGFRYGEATDLGTSGPLPQLGPNASMSTRSIPAHPVAAGWTIEYVYNLDLPNDGWSERQEFLAVQTTTLDYLFSLDTFTDGRPILRQLVTTASGLVTHEASNYVDTDPTNPFFGEWKRFRVWANQASANTVEVRVERYNFEGATSGFNFTLTGRVGRVTGLTTRFGPELEGMGIGHMTIVGAPDSTAFAHAFRGFDGEPARQRMARLSATLGVPVDITGQAGEVMGSEQTGTYLEVMEEAQAADFGAPDESRSHLGLTYTGRDRLYHAEPALVLDYASGEVSPPVEPTDDDQALRNDVEVKRRDGSAAQVEDTTGPLGVERVGRYDESVTLNLGSDRQAEHHAGWRVHLGTVDELRWPVIRLNLGNPRLSARVEDILGLDAGDRIRILNPPPWTQSEHLDLIVQGYSETLNSFTWEIELTCTPASPWQPARMANGVAPPDAPMRADTAGSELATSASPTVGAFVVATTRGPVWVTTDENPDSFPFDITVGGEVMRVTGIGAPGPGGGQTFTVTRAINNIIKPHQPGTPVSLAHPAVVAL